MKRVKGTAVGALLLALALVALSGCGGKQEQKAADPASQPAAAEKQPAAKPADAASKPADPAAKPASGTAYAIVAGESKASYEVKEVFLIESLNATAIGTTTAIKGDLVVENGTLKPSTVVVDVSQLKSDRSQRDNQLKNRGLETSKYPTAEFTITGMEGGPLKEGEEVAFKLTGRARIHGVEQPLTWDARAKLEGETLRLNATVSFNMELFQIEPPNIAGRIRVDQGVKLIVDFVAKKG
ncbi:MAG: YceI family protein [Bacillota bacterium]